ncbi:GNAT family N-acetyltransferase [Streptomyces gamaensis]|uniref:GNAT family N-acetyltransferase n=1 Tax=Streptomyces gamaensis TaxID=1763542 RepID=A0ABW0Z976_9ACTN
MTVHQAAAAVPGIRRARQEERDAIGRLIGEAFFEDPVSAWVFPDADRRRAVQPDFFGVFLDAGLRHGWVDVTDDLSAVAVWLPVTVDAPEGDHASGDDMGERLARADAGNERARTVVELMGRIHPTDRSHYYLPAIAAAPARQSAGRGRALLTATLDRCDAEGVPAYLEASSARSRALYARLGFTDTGAPVELPDGGPSLWPMWREPRP